MRSLTFRTEGRSVGGPREMAAIVEAIRAGDGVAAADAARLHVERAALIARTMLEERQKAAEREDTFQS